MVKETTTSLHCAGRRASTGGRRDGFTLLELLVATSIFAVLAGALYGVFSSALHMRERAYAQIQRELPLDAATDILRRDLSCMTLPGTGSLSQNFLGISNRTSNMANDTLELFTANGILYDEDETPWGEIMKVDYLLLDPPDRNARPGRELVREVTRNLLSTVDVDPEIQRLIGGVASLQFDYCSDQTWYDSWDASANDNAPPEAIRMQVTFVPAGDQALPPPPLVIYCPVAVQAKQSTETTTSQSTGSTSS